MSRPPRLLLGGAVERHAGRHHVAVSNVHIVDLDDYLDTVGAGVCRVTFLDAEMESASPADSQVPGLLHEHLEAERSDVELARPSQVGHEDEEVAQAGA